MLTTCLLLLFSVAGLRAQAANSEYNFVAYPYNEDNELGVQDGVGLFSTSPDMPILTMNCLAANGYGQWTSTTEDGEGAEYAAGWYLLENDLMAPYTAPCYPPGVVANGPFSSNARYAAQPKVTANLDGCVNYVFPSDHLGSSGSRESFDIEWFGPSDIDISLSGIPNDGSAFPSGTQIVTTSGHITHSKYATTNSNPIVNQTHYRDDFAVCSDAYYLYITWCSKTLGINTIYMMYLDLATHTASTPLIVGWGTNPTIACDPRYNRMGGPALWYEIGYVNTAGTAAVWCYNHEGSIGTYTTNNFYINPSDGYGKPFTTVDHVCALVSSVAGGSQYSALYAIVENGDGVHLVMYNPSNTNLTSGDAAYCDGSIMPPYTSFASLVTVAPLGPGWPILDAPIVAFANPYDNQTSWYEYDQFHCLYQLDLSSAVGEPSDAIAPLLIIRNADNGSANPTSPDPSSHDTRLVINQTPGEPPPSHPPQVLMTDPDTGYVATVTQMGIHVHWRNGIAPSGTHFYFRDWNRTFDEPIDENTLVTGICFVTDGSGTGTEHGGTLGATITKNLRMTLLSDMNYDFNGSDWTEGVYQPNYGESACALYLGSGLIDGATAMNGMRLTVGDGTSTSAATFTMGTNCQFVTDVASSGQGLTVSANSLFDYYGLYNAYNNSYVLVASLSPFTTSDVTSIGTEGADGGGDVFLNGTSSYNANMNVHGGADFHLNQLSTFESTYGNIDIMYEPNIFPISASGTLNSDASGVMEFECPATFTTSTVKGHFTAASGDNFMIHVMNSNGTSGQPVGQITSSGTSYSDPDGGMAVIRFDNSSPFGGSSAYELYGASSFEGDNFSAIQITAIDPQHDFTVGDGCTFGGTFLYAIDLEQSGLFSTYGNLVVEGNSFNPPANHAIADIFVYDLNSESISNINIENNSFFYGFYYSDEPFIGIDFDNSYGLIGNNTLKGGWYYAIKEQGPGSSPWDGTLICNNTITSWTPALMTFSPLIGIQTADYQGYVKLEDISNAHVGYKHTGAGGPPHLVFSNIHNNTSNGVVVDATLDMSGVHHDGDMHASDDIAGLNEIHDNGSAQINITSSSANLWITQDEYSSWWLSSAGQNDIFQGSGSSNILIQGDALGNAPADIGNNWWGGTVDPSISPYTYPNTTFFPDFKYLTDEANATESSISGIECSGGLITKGKGSQPQSVTSVDTSTCHQAIAIAISWNSDAIYADSAYDTMHYYILHCYQIANATETFGALGGCWGSELNTMQGRLNERSFLINALKLRNDNEWFCNDVQAIGSTYDDEPKRENTNDVLAILKYLIDNPRCAYELSGLAEEYDAERAGEKQLWNDTANVYYHNEVFDSTLPSMHDLGLDSVLMFGAQAGVHYDIIGPQIIGSAQLSPNPTTNGATVTLEIEREAYVHIELFDFLGNKIGQAGFEGVFEPGTSATELNLEGLPPGSYFVRITTANNEVRTLKLEKE